MHYERSIALRLQRPVPLAIGTGLLAALLWLLAATQASVMIAFGAVCGLLAGAAFFFSPAAAFLLVVAAIPLERIGRLTPDSSMYTVSIMRFVGILALGVFLLHAAIKRWKLRFGPAFVLYAVFCTWGICTVAFSTDTLGGVRAISATLGNLLFFFLVVNMVRSWKMVKASVAVWLLACTLIGMYTIYEWHTGRSRMEETQLGETSARFSTVLRDNSEWESLGITVDRALGTTSSPAVHGINMILTVPFFFFFSRTQREWYWKLAALSGCMVAVYNAFLTNTRAAIIVVAGTVLLCAVWNILVVTPRVLIAILACGALVVSLSPEAIYERVLKMSNYTVEGSGTLQTRLKYWQAGLQIISDNWLTGVGLGNQVTVPAIAKVEGPDESTVHNEYLEMMIETGIFGWTIFYTFVVMLLVCGFKGARAFRCAPQFRPQYWFMVACIIAMISVLAYAVQVDVFHFPLKGWWLVAGLTSTVYVSAREETRAASAPGRMQ